MKQFFNTLKAESIKLKHSGIPLTAYLLALVMPLIGIIASIYSFFQPDTPPAEPVYLFYSLYHQAIQGFIYLFYPIIIIVTASRIVQLEHKNNTWQLMETQPVEKAYLFNAKFVKAYQICFYSILFFFLGFLVNLGIDYLLKPKNEGYILEINILFILQQLTKITLCTSLLLAVIYAVSVRFSNILFQLLSE